MADDVERIDPDEDSWQAFHAVHLARYRFAVEFLRAEGVKKVLDAACGVGYGTQFLATGLVDAAVLGVDIAPDAVARAQSRFPHPRATYLQDDCHTLAAAAVHGPFDALVSFETMEHLPRATEYLAACRARLRDEGRFIVSTPNRAESPDRQWAHHFHEYMPTEFEATLKAAGFRDVELWGQALTPTGRFRQDIRAEANLVRANPLFRIGNWIQRLRGHRAGPALPAREEDYCLGRIESTAACEALGRSGPFVLLATARK